MVNQLLLHKFFKINFLKTLYIRLLDILKYGNITQLVECMLCTHKVIGSNPIISNNIYYSLSWI